MINGKYINTILTKMKSKKFYKQRLKKNHLKKRLKNNFSNIKKIANLTLMGWLKIVNMFRKTMIISEIMLNKWSNLTLFEKMFLW